MKKIRMMVASTMAAGVVSAAVMTGGYTLGTNSQLHADNGGAGSTLFVDYAFTGGSVDATAASGVSDAFTVLIDGAGKWRNGDTVEITGFALAIHSATEGGTMTFTILEGAGGTGTSGAGGLATIGTATASYAKTGVTDTMYANFDVPVVFVVDTNTFKIGVNIANTANLRIKADPSYPVPRYNKTAGNLIDGMRVSLAGHVTPVAVPTNSVPVIGSNPFSRPTAYTGTSYNRSLADVVSDPDNDVLTFSILSFSGPGSDWLGFNGSSITGTPQVANIGANEWVIRVVDGLGGTNTATMNMEVLPGSGVMISGYTVGSGLLSPHGETLFVDTAAAGGSVDLTDADGFNVAYTVLIPGAGLWTLGDTVQITGFALQVQGVSSNGTMTFNVRQGSGGIGDSGAGGLASLGTATAQYNNSGANSTMYVNFDTPVSFVADANSTNIGINISNTGNLRIKAQAGFPVTRYNQTTGVIQATNMKVSVAGKVLSGVSQYDAWTTNYGVTNGPAGDHDNDGLSNLYEYGLGGNPTNGFVDGNLPTFGKGAGGLAYVHARRAGDPSLAYYLNLTDNLVYPAWTNQGYTVAGTNVTGGTFDYVTNLIDTVDSAKFIKLIIEKTP